MVILFSLFAKKFFYRAALIYPLLTLKMLCGKGAKKNGAAKLRSCLKAIRARKSAQGGGTAKSEFLKKSLVLFLQGLNPRGAACHRLFFTPNAKISSKCDDSVAGNW
jgi:hypothetical protein